jgi:hypothetical protein
MRDRTSDQVTAAFQNTKPPALRIHRRSGTLTFSEEVDATTDALVPLHYFSPCGFGPLLVDDASSVTAVGLDRHREREPRPVVAWRADSAVRQRSRRSVPPGSACGSPTCLAAPPRPRRRPLLHHGVAGAGTGRARCGRRAAKQQSGALRR